MNEYPKMPDGERMLRIRDVAELLRISDKTVRMIDEGQLRSNKLRGVHLIRWSDVQKLLKQPA